MSGQADWRAEAGREDAEHSVEVWLDRLVKCLEEVVLIRERRQRLGGPMRCARVWSGGTVLCAAVCCMCVHVCGSAVVARVASGVVSAAAAAAQRQATVAVAEVAQE